jgi:hypothetical protein
MGTLAGAECVDCGGGSRTAIAGLSAAIYSLMGIGVDALIVDRTTLYEAPRASVHSQPFAGAGGIQLAVRW